MTKGKSTLKILIEAEVDFNLNDEMVMTVNEVAAGANVSGEIDFEVPRVITHEDGVKIKITSVDAALRYVSFRATENLKKAGLQVLEVQQFLVDKPDKEDLN